ncbi:MAG TPA: SgcJ/EcaC family oxidoreductase [Candidatus Dormibacteraeota bacterium]|nr:SgcJ/EcaC family oxidoreductase [Candidatus Dormibacteraeota bacterium]
MNDEVIELYRRLIAGWNAHDAAAMAEPLAADALVIGFDGSQMLGRQEFETELSRIFVDHRTASYVVKVRSVNPLGTDAALLHAVVGMVPPGGAEIMPDRNAVQTVIAARERGVWQIALFQTTPAQFHGRPELSEALTSELEAVRREGA